MARARPAPDVAGSIDRYRIIFVVGCPRSGTTWARSILQEHPDVVTGDESHVFDVLYGAVAAADRKPQWRDLVLERFDERARVAKEKFGNTGPQRWIERGALEQLLERISDGDASKGVAPRLLIEGILDAFFSANGGGTGKILVEKTPRHLMYARKILGWWPEAKFVELVRDGRDVCVSLQYKSKSEAWASAERAEQVRRWVEAVSTGGELRSDTTINGRWHMVRYEDLTTNGDAEVRSLFDFTGLTYDDDEIAQVVEATAFENAQRPGNANHVRKGMVGDWRNHFTNDDRRMFDQRAGRLLKSLGYEPSL